MTLLTLPDTLPELGELVGTLPHGDTPAAWWGSVDPDILASYARFQDDHRAWRGRMAQLQAVAALNSPTRLIRIGGLGSDYVLGLIPSPTQGDPPPGWRMQGNYLVPRKRTRAEKNSPVNQAFQAARKIPRACDYLDGLPNTLWTERAAYPVHARKTGQVVLAFVGVDPAQATLAFVVGPQWSRLKLSTYHALQERQRAAAGV